MHILHLIDTLALGGAERMLVDIANCSVAKGLTVSVCQSRPAGLLTDELTSSITRLSLERRRRLDLPAMKRLADFLRQKQVDLVHVHSRSSLQLLAVTNLLYGNTARVLFHDHYGVDLKTPLWFRVLGNHLVDRYVGVSKELARWAENSGIDVHKISTVPNYIDLSRFDKKNCETTPFELPESGVVGIVVCGLREVKGIHLLIKALSLMATSKLKVVFCGGEAEADYLDLCRKLADDLGVADRIVFAGQRRDIAAHLHRFDVAIMPSLSESGPLVLIEYLANGLPIIATRTGEIGAVIERCGIGQFVPPGNPQELAAALDAFFEKDSETRRVETAKGIEVARQNFDLRSKIDRWIELYQNCLKAA